MDRLDEPIPVSHFRINRKIKCLPLLEPKILDQSIKRLKIKRRNVRRILKNTSKSMRR